MSSLSDSLLSPSSELTESSHFESESSGLAMHSVSDGTLDCIDLVGILLALLPILA